MSKISRFCRHGAQHTASSDDGRFAHAHIMMRKDDADTISGACLRGDDAAGIKEGRAARVAGKHEMRLKKAAFRR